MNAKQELLTLDTSLHPTTRRTPRLDLHTLRRIEQNTLNLTNFPNIHILLRQLDRRSSVRVPRNNPRTYVVQHTEAFT